MKQSPSFGVLVFLFLLLQTGIVSAGSLTTSNTTTATITEPERTGGSIFFETYPPGATIWLDNSKIGTSAFTFYSEKTGTMDVRVWKKGYENYTATVTVEEGKRVVFYALLTPVSQKTPAETAVTPVTTAPTIRKSTMNIPTPWPSTPESPGNPAVVIGAAAAGIGFFVIRRR